MNSKRPENMYENFPWLWIGWWDAKIENWILTLEFLQKCVRYNNLPDPIWFLWCFLCGFFEESRFKRIILTSTFACFIESESSLCWPLHILLLQEHGGKNEELYLELNFFVIWFLFMKFGHFPFIDVLHQIRTLFNQLAIKTLDYFTVSWKFLEFTGKKHVCINFPRFFCNKTKLWAFKSLSNFPVIEMR
jgi:hypothetical protein